MLANDYRYVNVPTGCEVTGNILPVRDLAPYTAPLSLRMEDLLFACEAANERMRALYGDGMVYPKASPHIYPNLADYNEVAYMWTQTNPIVDEGATGFDRGFIPLDVAIHGAADGFQPNCRVSGSFDIGDLCGEYGFSTHAIRPVSATASGNVMLADDMRSMFYNAKRMKRVFDSFDDSNWYWHGDERRSGTWTYDLEYRISNTMSNPVALTWANSSVYSSKNYKIDWLGRTFGSSDFKNCVYSAYAVLPVCILTQRESAWSGAVYLCGFPMSKIVSATATTNELWGVNFGDGLDMVQLCETVAGWAGITLDWWDQGGTLDFLRFGFGHWAGISMPIAVVWTMQMPTDIYESGWNWTPSS